MCADGVLRPHKSGEPNPSFGASCCRLPVINMCPHLQERWPLTIQPNPTPIDHIKPTPSYLVMSVDARPSASRRRAPWTATPLRRAPPVQLVPAGDDPAWCCPLPIAQAVLRNGGRKMVAGDDAPVSTKTLKHVMATTRCVYYRLQSRRRLLFQVDLHAPHYRDLLKSTH